MGNDPEHSVTWAEAFRDVANNFIDRLPIILCLVVLIASTLK